MAEMWFCKGAQSTREKGEIEKIWDKHIQKREIFKLKKIEYISS